MNDQDLTDLLHRTVASDAASPAPVRDVTARGRRRIRILRVIEVGGTALVVAAVAIGASVMTTGHHDQSPDPAGSTSPTEQQLLGDWHLTSPTGTLVATGPVGDPDMVTFASVNERFTWTGYNGCRVVSAPVYLGPHGSFAAPLNLISLPCSDQYVAAGARPITAANLIESAASAQLVGNELDLYNASDHRIATFDRGAPVREAGVLPGRAPRPSELAGTWHWMTSFRPSHAGTQQDPTLLTFRFMAGESLPGHAQVLHWSGYAGCNNFGTGEISLGAGGQFATERVVYSDFPCRVAPEPDSDTVDKVVTRARWARIVDGRLLFYGAGKGLDAMFRRIS